MVLKFEKINNFLACTFNPLFTDKVSKKNRWKWTTGSVILGVPTLGLAHATYHSIRGCVLTYRHFFKKKKISQVSTKSENTSLDQQKWQKAHRSSTTLTQNRKGMKPFAFDSGKVDLYYRPNQNKHEDAPSVQDETPLIQRETDTEIKDSTEQLQEESDAPKADAFQEQSETDTEIKDSAEQLQEESDAPKADAFQGQCETNTDPSHSSLSSQVSNRDKGKDKVDSIDHDHFSISKASTYQPRKSEAETQIDCELAFFESIEMYSTIFEMYYEAIQQLNRSDRNKFFSDLAKQCGLKADKVHKLFEEWMKERKVWASESVEGGLVHKHWKLASQNFDSMSLNVISHLIYFCYRAIDLLNEKNVPDFLKQDPGKLAFLIAKKFGYRQTPYFPEGTPAFVKEANKIFSSLLGEYDYDYSKIRKLHAFFHSLPFQAYLKGLSPSSLPISFREQCQKVIEQTQSAIEKEQGKNDSDPFVIKNLKRQLSKYQKTLTRLNKDKFQSLTGQLSPLFSNHWMDPQAFPKLIHAFIGIVDALIDRDNHKKWMTQNQTEWSLEKSVKAENILIDKDYDIDASLRDFLTCYLEVSQKFLHDVKEDDLTFRTQTLHKLVETLVGTIERAIVQANIEILPPLPHLPNFFVQARSNVQILETIYQHIKDSAQYMEMAGKFLKKDEDTLKADFEACLEAWDDFAGILVENRLLPHNLTEKKEESLLFSLSKQSILLQFKPWIGLLNKDSIHDFLQISPEVLINRLKKRGQYPHPKSDFERLCGEILSPELIRDRKRLKCGVLNHNCFIKTYHNEGYLDTYKMLHSPLFKAIYALSYDFVVKPEVKRRWLYFQMQEKCEKKLAKYTKLAKEQPHSIAVEKQRLYEAYLEIFSSPEAVVFEQQMKKLFNGFIDRWLSNHTLQNFLGAINEYRNFIDSMHAYHEALLASKNTETSEELEKKHGKIIMGKHRLFLISVCKSIQEYLKESDKSDFESFVMEDLLKVLHEFFAQISDPFAQISDSIDFETY